MRESTVRDARMFLLPILSLILLAVSLGSPLPVWAGEAPPAAPGLAPYSAYGKDVYPGPGEPQPRFRRPVREFFQRLKTNLEDTDPFFRDTDLNLHFRTYYLGSQTTTPGKSQEAWAAGVYCSRHFQTVGR